jgi:hypothetical protein
MEAPDAGEELGAIPGRLASRLAPRDARFRTGAVTLHSQLIVKALGQCFTWNVPTASESRPPLVRPNLPSLHSIPPAGGPELRKLD